MNNSCPYCGGYINTQCKACGFKIPITKEMYMINEQQLTKNEQQTYEKGELIKCNKREHPWYGTLGIIREINSKIYTIEINGQNIKVTEDWIEKANDNNSY